MSTCILDAFESSCYRAPRGDRAGSGGNELINALKGKIKMELRVWGGRSASYLFSWRRSAYLGFFSFFSLSLLRAGSHPDNLKQKGPVCPCDVHWRSSRELHSPPSSAPFTYYTTSLLDGDTASSFSSSSSSSSSTPSSRHHLSHRAEGGGGGSLLCTKPENSEGDLFPPFFFSWAIKSFVSFSVLRVRLWLGRRPGRWRMLGASLVDWHLLHMQRMVGAMNCARRASPLHVLGLVPIIGRVIKEKSQGCPRWKTSRARAWEGWDANLTAESESERGAESRIT